MFKKLLDFLTTGCWHKWGKWGEPFKYKHFDTVWAALFGNCSSIKIMVARKCSKCGRQESKEIKGV